MIRPFTCLALAAALGAGLYLYQEKHRAQLLDRDIAHAVKQAEQSRERIGLLKAEWAALNEPARLAGLATQHLQLQPLQPAQFAKLEDLRSRLPAIVPVSAAPGPASMDDTPVAAAAPLSAPRLAPAGPQLAAAQPTSPPVVAAAPVAVPSATVSAAAVASVVAKPMPAPAIPQIQMAAAHPLVKKPTPTPEKPMMVAKANDAAQVEHETAPHEPAPREPAAPPHRLFAPVMHAYSPAPLVVHAPTVQTASVTAPQSAPFVGSALGAARVILAPPVPVGSSGYASGQ